MHVDERRSGGREPRHGVHVLLLELEDAAERREDPARRRDMPLSGPFAGREHGRAAADAAGRVRHRPDDRHARSEDLLELGRGDSGGDRDHQRPRRKDAGRGELARHFQHLHRFEREHHDVRAGHRRDVVGADRDAELRLEPRRGGPGARRPGEQALGVMALDQAAGDRLPHHSEAEDGDLRILHRGHPARLSDASRRGGRRRAWRGSKRCRSRRPRTTSGRRGRTPGRG